LLVAMPAHALQGEHHGSGGTQRFAVSVDKISNCAYTDSAPSTRPSASPVPASRGGISRV
jgi:hypothetical protein